MLMQKIVALVAPESERQRLAGELASGAYVIVPFDAAESARETLFEFPWDVAILAGGAASWAADLEASPNLGERAIIVAEASGPELREKLRSAERIVNRKRAIALLDGRERFKASIDPATGLHNARYLEEMLEERFESAKNGGGSLSVLLIDVDHLRRINEEIGHRRGELVLVEISDIVAAEMRTTDLLARYGGGEFAMLLESDFGRALAVAENLRAAVEQRVLTLGGSEVRCTVSIGVASYPRTNFETCDDLLESAEQAVVAAKAGGRNRVDAL